MIRATTMAAAFANAVVSQDPAQKNWVSRTVIDRAMHTNVGNIRERDVNLHLSRKTATQLGLRQKTHDLPLQGQGIVK